MIRTEDGAVVGSINVAALEQAEADAEAEGGEDLHSLLKPELVERAEGVGIDTSGLTKAELVEALESQRGG